MVCCRCVCVLILVHVEQRVPISDESRLEALGILLGSMYCGVACGSQYRV